MISIVLRYSSLHNFDSIDLIRRKVIFQSIHKQNQLLQHWEHEIEHPVDQVRRVRPMSITKNPLEKKQSNKDKLE